MALINCPECNSKMSDQANSCPKCGCPKSLWENLKPSQMGQKNSLGAPHSKGRDLYSWLFPCVEDSLKVRKILENTDRISKIPTLKTFNGCGQTIYGSLSLSGVRKLIIKMTFLSLFFIPIIPTGVYLVEELDNNSYKFYGKIRISRMLSILNFSEWTAFFISTTLCAVAMIVALILALIVAAYLLIYIRSFF
jgi:hypothetical protein